MPDAMPSEGEDRADWQEKLKSLVNRYGCEVVAAEMGTVLRERFPPWQWFEPTLHIGSQVFPVKDVHVTITPPTLITAVNELGQCIADEVGPFKDSGDMPEGAA